MTDQTMDTTKAEESFMHMQPNETVEIDVQTEPIIEEVPQQMQRFESTDVDMNDEVVLPATNNQIAVSKRNEA